MSFQQVAIAFDQLCNAILGGMADETLSARAWRQRDKKKRWAFMRRFIDCLFFFQKDHCYESYKSEMVRNHLPKEYRELN